MNEIKSTKSDEIHSESSLNEKTIKEKTNKTLHNIKKRHWAFILYPESVADDWMEILQQTGLPCAISPLHDKDIHLKGELKGQPKKPHYHVIAAYSGPTSFNVVSLLASKLKSLPPEPVENMKGYYNYLSHKNNPDKYKYDEKDIKKINGYNILDFVELSKIEVNEIMRSLQIFIREKRIIEYCDLMDFLLDESMFAEHDVASNHTYFFDKYISSLRNKSKCNPKETTTPKVTVVDGDTGEILNKLEGGDACE